MAPTHTTESPTCGAALPREPPLDEPLLELLPPEELLPDELPLETPPEEVLLDEPLLEELPPDELLELELELAEIPSVEAATIECDVGPHGSVVVNV